MAEAVGVEFSWSLAQHTLREAIADLAEEAGVAPEELTAPTLALVRKLLGLGFLERTG